MGHRVVLIVDNCGIGLHKKLAAKIASSECLVSVITVEYDINDDEPQDTEVFTLEPASPDLIEKLLENRYPAIALRVLTIFDGLIFTLFEVQFPFRFPHAVGENGKREWEPDVQRRVVGWSADNLEIRDRVASW
jgi:hypothetical protein